MESRRGDDDSDQWPRRRPVRSASTAHRGDGCLHNRLGGRRGRPEHLHPHRRRFSSGGCRRGLLCPVARNRREDVPAGNSRASARLAGNNVDSAGIARPAAGSIHRDTFRVAMGVRRPDSGPRRLLALGPSCLARHSRGSRRRGNSDPMVGSTGVGCGIGTWRPDAAEPLGDSGVHRRCHRRDSRRKAHPAARHPAGRTRFAGDGRCHVPFIVRVH